MRSSQRIAVTAVLSAGIGVLLVETLRWIDRVEAKSDGAVTEQLPNTTVL